MEMPDTESEATEQIYPCDDCDLQIEGIANLLNHRKLHYDFHTVGKDRTHLTEYCRTCPLCIINWATTDEIALKRKHKPFRYDAEIECLLSETTSKNRNACMGNESFECPQCDRKFALIYNLKTHFKRVHCNQGEQYACRECKKVFATKQYYEYHARIHTDKCFQCPHCNKKCGHRKNMNLHMKRIHHKDTQVIDCMLCSFALNYHKMNAAQCKKTSATAGNSCPFCHKEFPIKANLKCHIKRMHSGRQFTCEVCTRIFINETTFTIHKRIHTNQCYVCPHCSKKFTFKSKLKAHVETIHEEIKFACDQCPKSFASKEYLKYHKTMHTEFCVKCAECGKKFGRPYQLVTHMNRMHRTDIEKLNCDFCPKTFTSKDFLRCHLRLHTGNEFCCQQCNKKFIRKFDLTAHVERMHTNPNRNYPCDVCAKTFRSRNNLKEHQILHTPNCFTCAECSKNFSTAKKLNLHIAAVHKPKEKTVPCDQCDEMFAGRMALRLHKRVHRPEFINCPQCGKVFKKECHLRRHISRNHHDEEYSCSRCPKIFKNKDSLNYHEKYFRHLVAGQEQILACSTCKKTFSSEITLKLHEKIHTGESPSCHQCEKRFAQSSELRKHIERNHNDSGRLWNCDSCPKTFKTADYLKAHKILHTDRCFTCVHCEKKFVHRYSFDRHLKTRHLQQETVVKTETIIDDDDVSELE